MPPSAFLLCKNARSRYGDRETPPLPKRLLTGLEKTTKETIQQAFSTVSVNDVKQWVSENLGETLTSKRLATYKEFHATQGATKLVATT